MGRSVTKIRLPYIQEYKDRTGKVRRYLRRPGYKRLPLPGTPGSRQFMAAYEAGLAVREAPRHKHDDGTIGALVVGFYRSSLFTRLKPSSQRLYRSVLDKFSQEDSHRLVRDAPCRSTDHRGNRGDNAEHGEPHHVDHAVLVRVCGGLGTAP
jgi:hypothetical protein